ncbi:MAG: hypothetical protein DWQ05_16925 [Calditrichaeota bacterium]|nr:MAG: hypothetical protein DWQ05_16925 [Calditrichota bacterium]
MFNDFWGVANHNNENALKFLFSFLKNFKEHRREGVWCEFWLLQFLGDSMQKSKERRALNLPNTVLQNKLFFMRLRYFY